jgi:hypothetical protein
MRRTKATLRERMRRAEETALAELEWFFTRAGGTVPKEGEASPAVRTAAGAIQGWLDAITTFHAGALALRYTPRDWPEPIEHEFGEWSSVVVRLECALHPSDGRTSSHALETAAAARLVELLAAGGGETPEVIRLVNHAFGHVRAAVRAYVKVRGFGPSVLRRRDGGG